MFSCIIFSIIQNLTSYIFTLTYPFASPILFLTVRHKIRLPANRWLHNIYWPFGFAREQRHGWYSGIHIFYSIYNICMVLFVYQNPVRLSNWSGLFCLGEFYGYTHCCCNQVTEIMQRKKFVTAWRFLSLISSTPILSRT